MTAVKETCPSCEDLAAFLDGKLSSEERARGLEHLAGCESCYALFSEVVRFREESAAQGAEEEAARPVAPFERRAARRRWLPAAVPWRAVAAAAMAAILLVGIGIPVYRYFTVVPELDSPALLASLQGKAGELMDRISKPPTYRGPNDSAKRDLSIDEDSFQMGVLLVDLRVAMEASSKDKTLDVLRRIGGLLNSGLVPPELIARHQRLKTRIESGTPPRALLGEAAALERTAAEGFDPPHLSFGKWAEAAQLAAAAGDSRFFTSRETRRFLAALLRQKGEDRLQPEEAREIAGIQATLARSPLDLAGLRTQLAGIVQRFFRTSAS